jgi:NAD-dependent dihydropyrimidine dehydrogenase PreA subunit
MYYTTTYYFVIVCYFAKIFHQVSVLKHSIFNTLQGPELSESETRLRRILKEAEAFTQEMVSTVPTGGANFSASLPEKGNAIEPEQKADSDTTLTYNCGETFFHFSVKSGSQKGKIAWNQCENTVFKNVLITCPRHTAEKLNAPELEEKTFNTAQNCDSIKVCPTESEKILEVDGDHLVGVAHDLEDGINSGISKEGDLLLSAARAGDLKLIKKIFKNTPNVPISYKDETGNTPLHLATMSGSADSVKYLVDIGADLLLENKNKCTALSMILNNVPNEENVLMEVLNENIKVIELADGKEKLEISLKILCPENKNKMAIVDRLYTRHKHNKELLRHPVLKTFIHLKWKDFKYFMWYRAVIFFLYLLLLTLFAFYQERMYLASARSCLALLSIHLIIFCFPYFIPGHYSWTRRISKILLFAVPPILTLVSVSVDFNAEWWGVSYLFSWLSIPMYCTSFYLISQQAGMFIFVTKEVFKHCVVFFFVLAGFSITFYILYHDNSTEEYKNFWYTFLYTSLVLLQGDSLGDYRKTSRNSTSERVRGRGYVTYVTEALSALRFASVITSLLFVLLVIITLLNMLVALAVRGGNELMEYGQVYHLWNQAQLLYDCYEVKNNLPKCFSKFQVQLCNKHPRGKDKNKILDRDIPISMRNELTYLAKCKRDNNRFNTLMNEVDESMNENISALISQIQELRESLQTELKHA